MHRHTAILLILLGVLWAGLGGDVSAQPARHGLSAAQFELQALAWNFEQLRPRTLDATLVDGQVLFSGIWESFDPDAGPGYTFDLEMTASELQDTANRLAPEGYRPVSLAAYEKPDGPRFAVIWHLDPGKSYFWRAGLSSDEFQFLFNELSKNLCEGAGESASSGAGEDSDEEAREPAAAVVVRDQITVGRIREIPGRLTARPSPEFTIQACSFRLTDLDGYLEGSEARFFALWVLEGSGTYARHGMTREQFDWELVPENYQTERVVSYAAGRSGQAYAEISRYRPTKLHFVHSHLSPSDYQDLYNLKRSQGYRLIDIAVTPVLLWGGGVEARYTSVWAAPEGPDELLQITPPLAGIPNESWFLTHHQDHRVATGVVDHQGGTWSYDGHNGSDLTIRNFPDMDAGLDVIAAAPGVVQDLSDGDFDRNVCNTDCGPCVGGGNWVTILHQNGQQTWYQHLKEGSIIVSRGQSVARGQKIGEVGSSGNSGAPHLHFGVLNGPNYSWGLADGDLMDPFEGPSGNSVNLWQSPPPYGAESLSVMDVGVSRRVHDLCEYLDRPADVDRFKRGETVHIWMQLSATVDEVGQIGLRLYDPSGDLRSIQNLSEGAYQWSWPAWTYSASDLAELQTGRWSYEIRRLGRTVSQGSFEVQ